MDYLFGYNDNPWIEQSAVLTSEPGITWREPLITNIRLGCRTELTVCVFPALLPYFCLTLRLNSLLSALLHFGEFYAFFHLHILAQAKHEQVSIHVLSQTFTSVPFKWL